MWRLHQFPLCPFSRAVRFAMAEKGVSAELVAAYPWERGETLSRLNPAIQTPVLENGQMVLCDSSAIIEYFDETVERPPLLGASATERAEARRLATWFNRRFIDEVDAVLLHERMEKPLLRLGPPEARMLREGRDALRVHLVMLEGLAAGREWLAGRRLSQADLIAAGHLSVLDYFGEITWASYPALKTWYSKLKSRPCFRPLLTDRFPGVQPATWYADLDF